MRTTINIEDDALEVARSYAHARALNLGTAVSELIRRGLETGLPIRKTGGVWVFELPPDTPTITGSEVQRLLDEGA